MPFFCYNRIRSHFAPQAMTPFNVSNTIRQARGIQGRGGAQAKRRAPPRPLPPLSNTGINKQTPEGKFRYVG